MKCPNCGSTNLRYIIYEESSSSHELDKDGFIGNEIIHARTNYNKAEIRCGKCYIGFPSQTSVKEGRLKAHF